MIRSRIFSLFSPTLRLTSHSPASVSPLCSSHPIRGYATPKDKTPVQKKVTAKPTKPPPKRAETSSVETLLFRTEYDSLFRLATGLITAFLGWFVFWGLDRFYHLGDILRIRLGKMTSLSEYDLNTEYSPVMCTISMSCVVMTSAAISGGWYAIVRRMMKEMTIVQKHGATYVRFRVYMFGGGHPKTMQLPFHSLTCPQIEQLSLPELMALETVKSKAFNFNFFTFKVKYEDSSAGYWVPLSKIKPEHLRTLHKLFRNDEKARQATTQK